MTIVKHVLSTSGALAKGVGSGSLGLARAIGLKRGLIGLAIAGVATGGAIALARFLKQRGTGEVALANGVVRRRPKHSKAKHGAHAMAH